MATNVLKPPKYLDLLLCFIQKNEKKNVEGLIDQHPLILNEKCLDGLEPIFFCIRNKCNKIFKMILEKMNLDEELIKNIYTSIKSEGTPKMLKSFLDFLKISYDDSCLNDNDKEMLAKIDNKDDKNSLMKMEEEN